MGHQALGIYQASDSILTDPKTPVYSAVRKTIRPGIHSFHAMVALAYMVDYLQARMGNAANLSGNQISYFQFRLEELGAGLKIAVSSFEKVALTAVGECIYSDCVSLSKRHLVSR
jgi:hypothetical protein